MSVDICPKNIEKYGFLFMLFMFLLCSCEQRDPQAEYELLRVTAYESPKEGVEVANEYIDHFQKNKKARNTEHEAKCITPND